jgi:hypothetical protein
MHTSISILKLFVHSNRKTADNCNRAGMQHPEAHMTLFTAGQQALAWCHLDSASESVNGQETNRTLSHLPLIKMDSTISPNPHH